VRRAAGRKFRVARCAANGILVNTGFNERTWLEWLVKVRVIIVTFLLAIELAITTLTSTNVDKRLFVAVILLWYIASGLHIWMLSWSHRLRTQAKTQVITDLIFTTLVIFVTGGIDTSFNFLYPLIIILASILLSQAWAYLTAALSFILLGGTLELSFFDLIHTYQTTRPDLKSLQTVILINGFAFLTIAYLSGRLSNRLRQADVELQDKTGALENLQALHENIVNSISGGLITTDLHEQIRLVNFAGQRLLEQDEEEFRGRRIEDFFLDPLPRVGVLPTQLEVRAKTPSGVERTFRVTVTALFVPELGVTGHVYTLDDLTELRRLEREVRMRDRLAAIGRLASGIAHEIRNPLSSIAGSVKVLSGISALTDDQRLLVDIVTRESERLNAIITDFLAYSREKQYQMAPVDLCRLLDDTLTLLANRSEKIQIERRCPEEPAWAVGDGNRLRQVFWNLCENAVRAMPEGGTLTVTLEAAEQDWKITIRDTGTGIDPSRLEKIFEPFQSDFEGGTGLGLAIVYQIVQAHHGKISAHSEPGKGAEFCLCFRKAIQAAGIAGAATTSHAGNVPL